MRMLVFSFLLLWPCLSAASEKTTVDPVDRDILRGIELLYEGETDEAEVQFRNVLAIRPKDPAGHFYMAMVTWSRLTIGFWSPAMVEEYINRIDGAISAAREEIEEGKPDSYTYFYLGGALGFKGRFYLMEHKWFSSFSLAVDAVEALKTCRSMDPSNKDVLLGLGIFDYYTAKMSGVLKFITYLFLHRGDRLEGLRKLHEAAEEATFSSSEAKSVLQQIYLFLEEDYPKALSLSRDLARRYHKSRFYKYLEGVACIRMGMTGEYEEVLVSMRAASEKAASETAAALWLRKAMYLEATCSLIQGNYEEARAKLDAILAMADAASDPLMIAWPLLKKGVSYDLEGDRERALGLYTQVKEMENGAGAQFLAEKFTRKPASSKDPFVGY